MGSRHPNSNRPKKSSRQQREKRADTALKAVAAIGPVRTTDRDDVLAEILGAFSDALAVIAVSLEAVADNEHRGPEAVTLRLGVEALDRVYNRLDKAIIEEVSPSLRAKRPAGARSGKTSKNSSRLSRKTRTIWRQPGPASQRTTTAVIWTDLTPVSAS